MKTFIDEKRMYSGQLIKLAEESKETLTIRKEIILDKMSDDELGSWVRKMYKAKCESADELISRNKNK